MKIRPRSRSGVVGFALGLGLAAIGLFALTGVAQGSPNAPEAPAAPRAPMVITPTNETTYIPITPCRIIDTRAGTGTGGSPFTALQTRTYYVGGTFGFAPQGGKSGGCGIPVGATAIAATITAVDPTVAGYLRAWPNGTVEPTATVLNYARASTGTGATVPLNDATSYAMKLRSYGGTDVVVDVAGYYAKPMSALVQSDGVTYDGTSRATSSGRLGVGQYWVQFDRDITYCQGQASAYNTATYARVDTFSDPATNRVRVIMYNSNGAVTDSWFYLTVTC